MAFRKIFTQDAYREIGFGNKVTEPDQRLMNKDGSSNVQRTGLPFFQRLNFYHSLITMPWWKFNLLVLASYLIVNFLFALIYYIFTPNGISGMVFASETERFSEIFFFSAQSLTTVGYGRLNPTGILASTIAAGESMIGLLGFALATGLLYGRFSRPVAKVLFSEKAVIAPYKGISGLMIRIANRKKNELVDISAELLLAYLENSDRKNIRRFKQLKLELTRVNLLSTSWTIVHPIDDESPLKNWNATDYQEKHSEIILLLQAYDETFATTVHARTSYHAKEIFYGERFLPVIEPGPDGSVLLALDRISSTEHADLPVNEPAGKS